MPIPASDARALFTKTLIEVYQERIKPTTFLRGFFPTVTTPTKEVSIEVERMGEKVAVDVLRGTEGNRNTFSRSTEKIFVPPLYREYFDATQLDLYDRVLGSQGNAQAPLFAALLNSVADRVGTLQDKIERAVELQCSQVLEFGTVTLKQATSINFQRKAGSLVDPGAGNYLANAIDPFALFEAGCKFLRETGKSGDAVFNAILGSTALADLLNNAKFQARQNLFNMALDSVQGPVRDVNTGATFHGIITAGAYKVQLWAYPQVFEDPNNANAITPYINPKKVIMIPLMPKFKLAYGAVPRLIGEPGQLPVQGAYVLGEFIDERKAVHDFDIQSAPVAIPVAVDQIYTFKGVA
jgi:hypothetical protein